MAETLTLNGGENSSWNETFIINKQNGTQLTLETEKQYIDQDIELTFNVKSGTAAVTSGQSITSTPSLTFSNNQLTASHSTTDSIGATVSEAGWISSIGSATVTTSGSISVSSLTNPQNNTFKIYNEGTLQVGAKTNATGVITINALEPNENELSNNWRTVVDAHGKWHDNTITTTNYTYYGRTYVKGGTITLSTASGEGTQITTITPTQSTRYINISDGYQSNARYYKIDAVDKLEQSDITLDGVTISVPAAKYSYSKITKSLSSITVPVNTSFSLTTAQSSSSGSPTVSITNNSGRTISVTNAGTISTLTNSSMITTLTNTNQINTLNNSGTINIKSTTTTAGNVMISAYPNSGTTLTSSQSIVTNGRWKTTTVAATGTYYGCVIVNSHTGSWAAGTSTAGKATAAITNVNNLNASTSQPSGTSGTDYWQIKATASGTSGAYRASYQITNAGWIQQTTISDSQTRTITVTSDTTGKSLYIPKAKFTTSGKYVYCSTAGYIPAGSTSSPVGTVTDATFSNTETTGVTYTDYSSSAPVIPSGGYLYINAGYTSARKISLAKLVPDDVTVGTTTTSSLIHNTVSAYNEDGNQVVGTMATYAGGYGTTSTVPVTSTSPVVSATGTLSSNTGTITLARQNNTITLNTNEQRYVDSNIVLNVNITKAVLTTEVGSNTFDIEVPNGENGTVTFHFAVDANGNTTIT